MNSYVFAVFTIFKSQAAITDYYNIKKLRNIKTETIYTKTINFYKKRNLTSEELEKKFFLATYTRVTQQEAFEVGRTQENIALNSLCHKLFNDFACIDYDVAIRQIRIQKDKHKLGTQVFLVLMNLYLYFFM